MPSTIARSNRRSWPSSAAFFHANLGWAIDETSAADDNHHWAVLRTSTQPDTRPFDYLADF